MDSLSVGDCEDGERGTGYYPFTGKLDAFLYFLLHSPRPLVCTCKSQKKLLYYIIITIALL